MLCGPRVGLAATVAESRIFALGGTCDGAVQPTVEVYDAARLTRAPWRDPDRPLCPFCTMLTYRVCYHTIFCAQA